MTPAIPGLFPPNLSPGSLGPDCGNKGNNRFVLQLATMGCSAMFILIIAGYLSVTTTLSGQSVASESLIN